MLDSNVYKARMEKVQKHLVESNVDFALLTPSPNFQYLAGYEYHMRERLVALLISKDSEPCIIVPAFEMSDHASNTWITRFSPWVEDEDPYRLLVDTLRIQSQLPTAFLDDSIPLGVYWAIERAFGGFKKSLSITPKINEMRLRKSKSEIELMKKSGHIIDAAVMKAFSELSLGMTEMNVKQVVNNEIVRQGATPTFAAILFGEKSALPHADTGDRELRKGDVVLMDCGCSFDGYNTDMTRVGVVGNPTDEIKRVYSIVRKAEETAISKITRGMICGTADGLARRVIEDEGFGDFFTHRLGHGIGLEVHEPPYLVRGNSAELDIGMCHSVEPGIYLEGKFGIRVEDLVSIKEDGPEVITYSPRDLILIDII